MIFKKNSGLIALWVTFIISFIFVYSEAFYKIKTDYVKEMVLAFMAASVTILVTSLLLRQQTASEELKDSHSEIFKKKFEVYTEFFQNLISLFEDRNNKQENIQNIEESFYKLLLFVQQPQTFDIIYKAVLECLKSNNRAQIGPMLFALREELGIHDEAGQTHKKAFWNEIGDKMSFFLNATKE